MAETPTNTTQNTTPSANQPDPAKNNTDVANKLIEQSDLVNTPADPKSAVEALDALAEKVTKEREDQAQTPPEKKQSDTPPGTETPEQKKDREGAEAAAKKTAEDLEAADKLFKDAPSLPDKASPRSSEAFNSIKIRAAQEISTRDAEIEKLKKQVADFTEKVKNPLTPEVEKELQDHRTWRAKLDVEADPRFKEFDKQIDSTRDFIYSQLKKSPVVTDEIIAEIKKHGGPDQVKLEKLFAAIGDPTMQRIVESKIADIEKQKFDKSTAIEATKTNIQEYLNKREESFKSAVTQHTIATKQRVDQIANNLDWFKEKALDEKADDATKTEVKEHNEFIKKTREELSAALQDDSVDMRAILLVGMAQLFQLQRTHDKTKSELEAAQKSLAEVTGKWEKVKNSSTSRLRESSAPSNGLPQVKPADQFHARTGDALDSIAQKVMAERAAKSV